VAHGDFFHVSGPVPDSCICLPAAAHSRHANKYPPQFILLSLPLKSGNGGRISTHDQCACNWAEVSIVVCALNGRNLFQESRLFVVGDATTRGYSRMAPSALKGLKILEFCTTVSGAYCAKLMADLGAEVIKIETPGIGDGARRKPPFLKGEAHPEKSGLFMYINTSKFGVTLDPSKAQGKEIFEKLVKDVDVLIVDNPPGELEKMGLGYDALKMINAGLVMMAITPFGQSGPYKHYKAYQLNISQMSGQGYLLPMISPNLDRPPVKVGGNSGNFDPGLVASIAVMAALFWRGKSGKGQYIDMSKMEALMSMQRVESVTFPNSGVNMSRSGNAQRRSADGVLPCKDGYVVVVTPEEHQWRNFMKLIGDPPWSKEPWCRTRFERARHVDEMKEYILDWMKDKPKEEIFRNGQALSTPVAAANTAKDVVESPQFNARGFFVETLHPVMGNIDKFPSSPYRFSKTPWAISRPAPRLGEHNEHIFCTRLGFTREELAMLKSSGVV
jgi:CoA:oxalate CoA-transferase